MMPDGGVIALWCVSLVWVFVLGFLVGAWGEKRYGEPRPDIRTIRCAHPAYRTCAYCDKRGDF